MIECIDPDGCSVATACTTDLPARFEDYDLADSSPVDAGGILQTSRKWRTNEVCVARVEGTARITGLRYMKLRTRDDTMYYAGVSEVPVSRFGSVAQDTPSRDTSGQQPFIVVLMDARVVDGAPPVYMPDLEQLTRDVLGQMGFVEHDDYRIVVHDQVWDITNAAADVLDRQSSGPATNVFRKSILEATSYAMPEGHGLVYVGGVSEWPTGRDHGSYMLAGPDVQFVSFCNGNSGFLTCSIKEDCLGHELGHAFGLLHERHNWYGFSPTAAHAEAMRKMTRCAPKSDRTHDVWTHDTLGLLR